VEVAEGKLQRAEGRKNHLRCDINRVGEKLVKGMHWPKAVELLLPCVGKYFGLNN
jgi:hypothetical protein